MPKLEEAIDIWDDKGNKLRITGSAEGQVIVEDITNHTGLEEIWISKSLLPKLIEVLQKFVAK